MRKFSHSCIPELLRVYEAEQYVFLLMKLISGPNLFNMLESKRGTAEETLWVFKELCDLCAYLEKQGAVHLGLKHSCLVFVSRGSKYVGTQIKVLEWYYCRFPGDQVLEEAMNLQNQLAGNEVLPCGSPGHMAPEVLCQYGEPVSSKSDLYTAALVAYRL